ncbi:hypothetical protein GI364_19695 [Alicyclobacillus sp. SO9]|nr:hypothetical protein GI364_19695 [Alicyclobacillus sp. SO9]
MRAFRHYESGDRSPRLEKAFELAAILALQ